MTLQHAENRPEHPMLGLLRETKDLTNQLARVEQAAADGGPGFDAEVHEAARRLLATTGKVTVRQVGAITAALNHSTYHWVLTLTGIVDGRQKLVGDQGTVQPSDTDTRASVCERLVASLRAKTEAETGRPFDEATVLFFDLQPNALPEQE